jgi:hypothetical protein
MIILLNDSTLPENPTESSWNMEHFGTERFGDASLYTNEQSLLRKASSNYSTYNHLLQLQHMSDPTAPPECCECIADEGGGFAVPVPLNYFLIMFLIGLSAMFSGLTLGLLGLDKMGAYICLTYCIPSSLLFVSMAEGPVFALCTSNCGYLFHAGLQIVIGGGDALMAKYAAAILPIRENGNLLLTTLLLGNVSVNSLLSILMADMTSGLVGFFSSTILIVIFGEIIPQAACSRYALTVGYYTRHVVRVFIAIFYVFAYPLGKVLDWALGEDLGEDSDIFMPSISVLSLSYTTCIIISQALSTPRRSCGRCSSSTCSTAPWTRTRAT